MALAPRQIDLVRLIQRSNADEDGWYKVSKIIWPLVDGKLPDDLAETKASDDGGFIRFTLRGQAVADYL